MQHIPQRGFFGCFLRRLIYKIVFIQAMGCLYGHEQIPTNYVSCDFLIYGLNAGTGTTVGIVHAEIVSSEFELWPLPRGSQRREPQKTKV